MTERSNDEVCRPDPEDDAFACSICGCYLGDLKRVSGEENCDACAREVGAKSPLRQCVECGWEGSEERMEPIDVSPPGDYYPVFEYLCPSCSGGGGS